MKLPAATTGGTRARHIFIIITIIIIIIYSSSSSLLIHHMTHIHNHLQPLIAGMVSFPRKPLEAKKCTMNVPKIKKMTKSLLNFKKYLFPGCSPETLFEAGEQRGAERGGGGGVGWSSQLCWWWWWSLSSSRFRSGLHWGLMMMMMMVMIISVMI